MATLHITDVIAANRLVVLLSKARRRPDADVTRLDCLVERASTRAQRKHEKFMAAL